METALELALAPALVAAASAAGSRWGAQVGGLVSAFPAVVGPVLLVTAQEHGTAFAARAADGVLAGLVALSAFAVAYARAAVSAGWPPSVAAGWAAAAIAALMVGSAGAGSAAGPAAGVLSLVAAYAILPDAKATPAPAKAPRGEIALRILLTAVLVASVTAAAGVLGARAGGILAALPVIASVLAVSTHRREGTAALIGLLRGMLLGMAGFVAFCEVLAILIVPAGMAPAFALATACALVAQASVAAPSRLPALRRP